jgi:hypothetical protein
MKIGRPRRDKCGLRASSRPVAMVRAVAAACVGTEAADGKDGLVGSGRGKHDAQRQDGVGERVQM